MFSFPILYQILKKTLNWNNARLGTQAAIWVMVAMILDLNDKIESHISHNIKFRKETRENLMTLQNSVIKIKTNSEYIQRDIRKIEIHQDDVSAILNNYNTRISVLEGVLKVSPLTDLKILDSKIN